jgi:hypothetical protein
MHVLVKRLINTLLKIRQQPSFRISQNFVEYQMLLASRFSKFSNSLRSQFPLTDDQIKTVAPSIFAEDKHQSRTERYTYIPTIDIINGLRKEGFSPFMVCQSRTRDESKREHAKHMIRLRHANQIHDKEANEIILLNSHDGTSSYQMLGGVLRFVCQNGLIAGNNINDIRIPHKGDIVNDVIDGAFRVLNDFEQINAEKEAMTMLTLSATEQSIFAKSALSLKYDEVLNPAPIAEEKLLRIRRSQDDATDLWTTFNCVQENMIKGGLRGRTATGKTTSTRPVNGIDQNVKLNRALWILAAEMKKLVTKA